MKTPQTLFLAWQDTNSRAWFSIGRLTFDGGKYKFVYTQGVKAAQEKSDFRPLFSFPEINQVYTSTYLFPVFSNRLMSRSRPDYTEFLKLLNIGEQEAEPMTILARSGGEKKTDTLAVFPCPQPDERGRYQLYFFAHGLRYLPESAIERINRFEIGEKLWLAREVQNAHDSQALTLHTEDHYIVGYCPRYLVSEVSQLLTPSTFVELRVERVNLPSTPLQFRLLCQITALCTDNFYPFSSQEYQPLIEEEVKSTSLLRVY
ncbi:HIRAN domain-containing protein [Cronbergia sp. UHCC 0137]|uniref:HIRAN domain-containing protein n=1 Tax=Cronbergia sp. UHCC 0137 TaxID=3110239 RepID=UPI002B213BBC|nr:HIRAN domain-containing protein [Cronbergia sp. UHCC 0137]MEA5618854.1 HIRAN domain-containing protein [Cronbergia sp. UHCC 0137]